MVDIFISFLLYLLSFISHVCIYRLLNSQGIKSFLTVIVFGFGLLLFLLIEWPVITNNQSLTAATHWNSVRLPLSGLALYGLLSGLTILFFTAPYTNETSPSQKIIFLLERHKGLTAQRIYRHFSEYELIGQRLQTLIKTGYVRKRNQTLFITAKGQRLARFVNLYKNLFKWELHS